MAILPSLPPPDVKQFYIPSMADLPQEQRGWVMMDVSPLNVEDYLHTKVEVGDGPNKAGVGVIVQRIKDWNFTEEGSDEVLPINYDTVKRLGYPTLNWLGEQIGRQNTPALSHEEKKT